MTDSGDGAPRPLGPPRTLRGRVVPGDHRGRLIGFPTGNVLVDDEDLPAFGVYAGRLDGMPAAISAGVRPTFGIDQQLTLEAHVIGFDGDLYGQDVTVTMVARVRYELRFRSVARLTDGRALMAPLRVDPVPFGPRYGPSVSQRSEETGLAGYPGRVQDRCIQPLCHPSGAPGA